MLLPYLGKRPEIDPSAFIEESARIIGDVVIGGASSVWFNVVIRGDVHFIRIGERTNIQDGTVVHVTREIHPTLVGNEVTVGHNVTLHGCTIGDRCLIGIGAVLLDGVAIGEECLIAAGTVLSPGTIIPPRSLVMGLPGRARRELMDDEIRHLRRSAESYVGYRLDYRPDLADIRSGRC